jgi:hypothetical protein
MRRTWSWAAALFLCVPAVQALDGPQGKPQDKPKTPAEEYQALTKEYMTAQQEFFKLYQAAKTEDEKKKLVEEKYPSPDKYAARFLELAEKHPKDPAAVDALVWVTTYSPYGPAGTKAIALLARDHLQNEKIGQVVPRLANMNLADAEKLLRAVLEKNPNREAQAQACLALAQYHKNRSERGLPQAEAEKAAKEAEQLFDQVVAKYGDVKSGRGLLADAAKAELFEIRNLAIGKAAPEIEGEDSDGKRFKLSDYKGKVVVLDFWAEW